MTFEEWSVWWHGTHSFIKNKFLLWEVQTGWPFYPFFKQSSSTSICYMFGFHERRGGHQNTFTWLELDFPGGSDNKESTYNAGDPDLIPELGRSPREGIGYPLPYSCLKKSVDRGARWATIHRVVRVRRDWENNTFTFQNGCPANQKGHEPLYSNTHTHFSVSPAVGFLFRYKVLLKKYIYIFQWFLNLWPKTLGPSTHSLEGRTGHHPLSSSPCPCALSLWLPIDWSSETDDSVLCTQVL